jgi:hypothetical protein
LLQLQKQIPTISTIVTSTTTTSASTKGLVPIEHIGSPSHAQDDDWSDDGSTTVSIPNSPSPDDDDLDAMIMSNQFNKKNDDDYIKFTTKSATKGGNSIKRESSDHQVSPRKKMKAAK